MSGSTKSIGTFVIFDEYHFGAWRHVTNSVFDEEKEIERADSLEADKTAGMNEAAELQEALERETEFLPITSCAYLYLSGTPFKALSTGEFIEEQIFNWTYTDEQRAKADFEREHPGAANPYASLPQMRLLTYQMPDELLSIASGGEFDEFDLNEFFAAQGEGVLATFEHKDEVSEMAQHHTRLWRGADVWQLEIGATPALALFRRPAIAVFEPCLLVLAQCCRLRGN